MTITIDHLTRTPPTWGFPTGAKRRVKPLALLCLHCTGGTGSAQDERDYANRRTDNVSAHDYLDPDGSGIEAIDPAPYAAWSNGVLNRPASANPTIAAIANMAHPERGGYNPNELVYREVECVGTSPTDAQLATVAALVAQDAKAIDLPIGPETVLLHADFDSVNRSNCPCPPTSHERVRQAVIALATGGDMALDFAVVGGGGTFTVSGAGHQLFRLHDPSVRGDLAAGRTIAVAARIKLAAPLDSHPGDRQSAVLFLGEDGLSAEAALLADGVFTPTATPAPAPELHVFEATITVAAPAAPKVVVTQGG